MSSRLIHKTAARSRNEARELLELMFVTELLSPSERLWVVSAWLRDVPIIDNRSGAYAALAPDFPRTEIRLSRVLSELVGRGTRVVIATRPSPDGGSVGAALVSATRGVGVLVKTMPELHVKGIVGDHSALLGSMNLTNNGIENLTELLQFETDPGQLARLRAEFRATYGEAT